VTTSVSVLRRAAALLTAALTIAVAACAGDPGPPAATPSGGVRVASFNFAESSLIAEIYAQALEARGVEVRREPELGPRELVRAPLRQGLVDVVPEYLGSALRAEESVAPAGPGAETTAPTDLADPDVARRALESALAPWDLHTLQPAEAQNQNGLAVTRATARRLSLRTTSDLAAVAGRLRLGGPPECPERPYCLEGLSAVYGLSPASFAPFTEAAHVRRALDDGVVDVGVVFTTDGALAEGELVLLEDDRGLQPAENVVPDVRAEVLESPIGPRVAAALDGVSARLTTSDLRFLNWRVEMAGNAPADEARGWLLRHGLVDRAEG
jgi:osmoprotectant transport system substrate-binding protein